MESKGSQVMELLIELVFFAQMLSIGVCLEGSEKQKCYKRGNFDWSRWGYVGESYGCNRKARGWDGAELLSQKWVLIYSI